MKHLFVPSYISLMAKEKGFNEECCTYFLNQILQRLDGFGLMNEDFQDDEARIAAPLYQQLIDWFDTKDIFISIVYGSQFQYRIDSKNNEDYSSFDSDFEYKTRIEAMNAAFKEAFKLIK